MQVCRYDYADQLGDSSDLMRTVEQVLRSGAYVLSKEVAEFEASFADYLGAEHVCGTNSGTDAIYLALAAMQIGPGDEVITQANTFHATVAAICLVGATPVLVDASPETYLIASEQIRGAVTSRTRAILPVHLFGKATPMQEVLEVAERYEIAVVEDAAQAHGARIDGRRVGTHGHAGCFSFHPSKNLAAAGDGGAICTNDRHLLDRVRELRSLGQRKQNDHVAVGLNSKLDALQACVLSHKLPRLDGWNQQRRAIAAQYRERLADVGVGFQTPDEEHVYHLFQIQIPQRDALQRHLQQRGVDAVVRYPVPIHLQPAFQHMDWAPGQFPVAERLARELLCLPIRPNMREAEIDYTCEQVRAFFGASL